MKNTDRSGSVGLTAGCVDGVPQLSVLPLAQLKLLGIGGSLGGLGLRTSDRKQNTEAGSQR